MKAAVFSHSGLGDGLISLVISNNFHQNGWEVDTFHSGLSTLQSWFSHLPIISYPNQSEIPHVLASYDKIVVFHNDTNPFTLELVKRGKEEDSDKVKVIYAIPSPGVIHKPYYQDCLINPKKPIVENLQNFCSEILEFPKTTKKNGIIPPLHLKYRKHAKRVILHVASSRPGKNWPIEKFTQLAKKLRDLSFQPVMIAGGPSERKPYLYLEQEGYHLPLFESLHEVTSYIFESGYLIGNDSGLGHLASSMGIPTVTITRRKQVARFWRPSWAPSAYVVPSSWIPNLSGLRLRDRYWKYFISVRKVKKAFLRLVKKCSKT